MYVCIYLLTYLLTANIRRTVTLSVTGDDSLAVRIQIISH